jgi:DNA excision repair protein ERCC-5
VNELHLLLFFRHVFEDRMWAEEYRAEDVGRELGMEQEHLIRLAMLLGSDYTEGVSGIGPSSSLILHE